MKNFKKHLININSSIKEALFLLDKLSSDAILFVVNDDDKLIGSFTDGDVRRGLIKGNVITDSVSEIIQKNPKFLIENKIDLKKLISFREELYKIIPILNDKDIIVDILNFREMFSILPIDACIMAGGKGKRLMPLTKDIPKPLVKIGDKPIIQYNLERLRYFGLKSVNISVNYLGDKLINYFKNGNELGMSISYIKEDKPLGTMGAIKNVRNFSNDYILIMNSDILTNIDFEAFFINFVENDADMSIVSTNYQVKIPYGIFELESNKVNGLVEKPTYNYFSNAGIYLLKKSVLDEIEKNKYFDATDLILKLVKKNYNVISYQFPGYWLDIGKIDDYERAKTDYKNIKFY